TNVAFVGNPMVFTSTKQVFITHGSTIYATVRCFNTRGLWSEVSSSGVTLIYELPDITNALIETLTNKNSHFTCKDGIQNEIDMIRIKWDGFRVHHDSIHHFTLNIESPSENGMNSLFELGDDGRQQATIKPMTFKQNQQYKATIQAVDMIGRTSDGVQVFFTTETLPPNITDVKMTATWMDRTTAVLTWADVFTSDSDIYYELTIGTNPGGSDIMKWVETKETSFTLYAIDNS
ncbi:unnamed protein product, partial [Owenia fusiformis]